MDYSTYYLDAKKRLDMAYQQILKKNINSAVRDIELAIAELRLMKAALKAKAEQ